MMVVPESMTVSKPEPAVVLPTNALAPVACQKPVDVSISWYSILPVNRSWTVSKKKTIKDNNAYFHQHHQCTTLTR